MPDISDYIYQKLVESELRYENLRRKSACRQRITILACAAAFGLMLLLRKRKKEEPQETWNMTTNNYWSKENGDESKEE